jgi:hypothetical protein
MPARSNSSSRHDLSPRYAWMTRIVSLYLGNKDKILIYERIFIEDLVHEFTNITIILQLWRDDHISWDPKEFAGLEFILIPSDKVWVPDIGQTNR